MACYNASTTISEAIESILAQSIHIELIIVDGGSTDGTLALIEGYGKRISHLISEPDQGLYDAINKGIKLATSDYIYIIGADDQLDNNNALEKLVLNGSGADVIYGDSIITDGAHASFKKAAALHHFKYFMPICHQAVIAKRTLLQDQPFRFSLASDYRSLYKLYLEGHQFHYVPGPVCHFALGGTSSRHAAASTLDRLKINIELRQHAAVDVICYYLMWYTKLRLSALTS